MKVSHWDVCFSAWHNEKTVIIFPFGKIIITKQKKNYNNTLINANSNISIYQSLINAKDEFDKC